jgi:tetratricopeptide (TPR) repeat protein
VSGYVVCRSCGTRIKAGRAFCLKCFEPLPEAGAAAPTSVWESLGLSATQQAVLTIGGGLIVVALFAVIWQTRPAGPVDDEARPVGQPAAARRPDAVPTTPASTESTAPAGAGVEPFIPTALAVAPAKTDPADMAALEARLASLDLQLAERRDDADVLNRKGQVLELMGRVGEAVVCFEQAVKLAPETRSYHSNLAHAAASMGESERAITEYREVARLRPDDYAAHYTLGMALQRKGDDEAAIPELQKAATLGPAETAGHLALGVSLERVGRVPEAVREYQRYVAILPNSAETERLKLHLAALAAPPQVK